jgi:hypothetical protein
MSSLLPSSQKVELVAELAASAPSAKPIDLAIALIMQRRRCSQPEAFAVLQDLRAALVAVSEVPLMRIQLAGAGVPRERWQWVAVDAMSIDFEPTPEESTGTAVRRYLTSWQES